MPILSQALADIQSEAIPHDRGPAVKAVVLSVRARVLAGMKLPSFGVEPASFLVALRERKHR